MKIKPPKISDAEWEIMNLIWDQHPITAAEIVARLAGQKTWNHKTIGTFLNRLTKKDILRVEQQGRRYLFYPQLLRDHCVQAESQSFLERVFCGEPGALLAHFAKEVKLTPMEIEELGKILTKKSRSKQGGKS